MKFFAVSFLAALAAASPIAAPEPIIGDLAAIVRQISDSKTELESGSSSSCPKAILVYARGSTEMGNLGTLGGPLGNALKNKYSAAQVWVQGVGGPYTATLSANTLPRGSTPAAIAEMGRLLNLASTKCPNSKIVAGGYSQGAALAAAAISDLDATVRNKVVGTVLFGYTKNQQNAGAIPKYPSSNLKVFCETGDLVCEGTLIITPAHLTYLDEAGNQAPQFLISKIGN
ncbi:cutinase-domain-containing protein [Ampelomyces quisqualis]|uniref:Cutinase n=1 Tax=Ampelomyces quisqualis TaxID=50730 RepID=A0A6A5QS29_AMPQU|nr:cutinase-domain-containing protein [Ampelomyces quisqualis]